MKEQVFIDHVLTSIPPANFERLSIRDLHLVRGTVSSLFQNGFSVEDATAYILCLEEVNPELDEDVALARMKSLWLQYGLPANEAHSI